jgi:hypothetical protein
VQGEARRDAESRCSVCHAEEEPHEGRLGETCGDCHGSESWTTTSFGHEGTDFPLTGSHASADCDLCHPASSYQRTPQACASCHRSEDAHLGRLGPLCGDCHEATEWKDGAFDHPGVTGFGLVGRHGKASCNDCHLVKGSKASPKLDKNCAACHIAQDDHDGSFGRDCESCHSPKGWSPTLFDHRRDARFALSGGHGSLDCTQCHHGVLGRESLSKTCVGCHSEDDLHAGQLGDKCDACHTAYSWSGSISFDHDMARLPLLGMHAVAACEDCHSNPRFRDTSTKCVDCHRKDDIHESTLGVACEECHNPNAWSAWRFDHDRRTSFSLRGEHEGLECRACHSASVPRGTSLSARCDACHSLDDPHRSGFGSRCETCHVERSWNEIRPTR